MQYLWIYMNGTRGEMCARAVVKHGWQVGALIVPADKGDFFKPLAKGIGCELIAVENVNSQPFMERVKQTRPLFGIIAGFQTIFSPQLIASHFHPVINLHAGKVPHYRGGSPLNWQIINGETSAGLAVLEVGPGIDDGPVLAETSIAIDEHDDIATLHKRANEIFPKLLTDALARMTNPDGPFAGTPQDDSRARYWLQRSDVDGEIIWSNMTSKQVHNLVRGVTRPYPGAWCADTRIWRTSLYDRIFGPPGRVAFVQGKGPYVCCSDSAILVDEYSGPRLRHGMCLRHQ